MTKLNGSEKQIAWATEIREHILNGSIKQGFCVEKGINQELVFVNKSRRIEMRELKNSELREVEEEMRSEETTMRDDSLHARYIIEICNQADTHFSAFKESGIYELTQTPDNNLETDIDIIIQEEFEKKVLEDPEECLQDLVSDKMYSTLQDIRNIARGFQESLIEENTEKIVSSVKF